MLILWIALGVVGLLVLAAFVMWVVGRGLPEEHVAGAVLRLSRTNPDQAWAAVTTVADYPSWSPVNRVERLPDRDGRETWRQWMGRNSFVLERTRHEPPRLVEYTIADDAKFFSGSWQYTVEPAGAGCAVSINEHGRVHVAIPRFMMHYMMDPTATARKQLAALATKLGEPGAAVEKRE